MGEHVEIHLRSAVRDVHRARDVLALGDANAVTARTYLESAVARLAHLAHDDDAPSDLLRSAQRLRTSLASHLLAAADIEAAGAPSSKVAGVLRRAVEV